MIQKFQLKNENIKQKSQTKLKKSILKDKGKRKALTMKN